MIRFTIPASAYADVAIRYTYVKVVHVGTASGPGDRSVEVGTLPRSLRVWCHAGRGINALTIRVSRMPFRVAPLGIVVAATGQKEANDDGRT